MDHVLSQVESEVWIPTAISKQPPKRSSTSLREESWSSYQLLATCKQAHLEGGAIFYSTHKFHLPPGSIDDTFWWPNNLQIDHKSLVKDIGIAFGLDDLTAAALKEIESSMPSLPRRSIAQDWAMAADRCLVEIWISKIKYIGSWPPVERVEIKAFGSTIVLDHDAISKNVHSLDNWRVYRRNPYWSDILLRARLSHILAENQNTAIFAMQ